MVNRIKEFREKCGLSQQALAAGANTSNQQISLLENGKRKLTKEWAERLAVQLSCAAADLIFSEEELSAQPLTQPPVILPALDGIPPVVPVMGTARGGVNGAFELNHGDPIAFIKRRPGVAGSPKAYALYVEGDSMEPRYFAGETIHIDPSRKVRPGDFVLIEQKFDEHDIPQAFIKRLVRRTATKVIVEQYNPPKNIDIPESTVITLHRVLLSNEVDGV
jgi:phage repressor protein C with HTH and peptisase S24 domain